MRNHTDDIISVQKTSRRQKIDKWLKRIANILLLNASFINNLGLLKGKMGIAIFFYHYAQYVKNKMFSDYAGELVDEIYEEINSSISVDFENGLTGIGWGLEYLVQNKFVQADTDDVLSEIDNIIYSVRLKSPILITGKRDLFGYGLYYLMRLNGHEINDNDLNTLIKKYHLIFLIDECERILLQKLYTRFNIESLSIETINSMIWFIHETDMLKIFPVKARKVLNCIPEYVIGVLETPYDRADKILLDTLLRKTIQITGKKETTNLLKELQKRLDNEIFNEETSDENLVSGLIKTSFHSLIYNLLPNGDNRLPVETTRVFSIIDDEDNWEERLNNLNNDNLGLDGLAGLGLGLLMLQTGFFKVKAQSSEHRA